MITFRNTALLLLQLVYYVNNQGNVTLKDRNGSAFTYQISKS